MNAKLVMLALAGLVLYGYQAGYIENPGQTGKDIGAGVGLVDNTVDVYWEKDSGPPGCATTGDGIDITAIARDTERRFDQSGTLTFQWQSRDGWNDFAREPTDCSQQTGVSDSSLFCTVSNSYGLSEETAINGENRVRAKLELDGETYTSSVRSTTLAGDDGC